MATSARDDSDNGAVAVVAGTLRIEVGATVQHVSSLWCRPPDARRCLVLAHGAGAGMTHAFMGAFALGLAARGVASLRYQFPFIERGSKRTDPPALAHAVVRAAVDEARRLCPDLPLFAGGKSFGGRMTSQAQALQAMPGVRGLVFVGFPLHPAGKPSIERSAHLAAVQVPMLFLQGTRDELAELPLIEGVCATLGIGAELHVVDDADHAFHVRAKSGRNDTAVREAMLDATVEWMSRTDRTPSVAAPRFR